MKKKMNEEELYKDMYGKLYKEVTKISEKLTAITDKLKAVQYKLEEYYISEGKSDI